VTGLSCRALTKGFPGVRALSSVDLDVVPGSVVVVLGENGAGKSTLAKILCGVYQPDSGEMYLDESPFAPSTPAAAIAAGVAMIHQEGSLLPELSVAENVFLGRYPLRGGLVDYSRMHADAARYLERVGASLDPATRVRNLSVAARQQVEIAKALSQEARVLILDEPTAALGENESERLFEVIDELKTQNVGFVYISHRLQEIARVGDAIVVLRDGEKVAEWNSADLRADELIEQMVGRPVQAVFPVPPEPSVDEVMHVEGLGRAGAFADVTFTLRRGEILGVAGLVGAGRTELVRALFGAEPADAGRVVVDGAEVKIGSPADAVEAGIVLVPEDRREQGLVLGLTMEQNLALPSLTRLSEYGVIRARRMGDLARELIGKLQIRGRADQIARTLSGGNQQKAVVGKWLPRKPRIVILDEPTRGIDVGAKAALYDLVRDLASEGAGVILVSSELPEVLGLSNRVLVMSHGRQTGLLERSEANEEVVMSKAVGG
jgi:ribose transport system ATP-binding protein